MVVTTELVQVNTRIERELQERLAERAASSERSVAAELRLAIRAWVEERDSETTEAAA